MVTVFTPTYNRAHTLGNLYNSLCRQTSQDFEWIIIDDGSKDNTQELVAAWMNLGRIPIRYFHQTNGGKHRAINRGVKEAKGEVFFIVDSDDYLLDDAVYKINRAYEKVGEDMSIAGVVFMKIAPEGTRIGGNVHFNPSRMSITDFRCKLSIQGDLAETVRLSIMKEFPFPEIEDERFFPEAYLWYSIDKHYKMFFINEGIYVAEYQPDGLSAKIKKLLQTNPISSTIAYATMVNGDKPIPFKLKNSISYWRYYFHSFRKKHPINLHFSILSILAFPLGYGLYLKDSILTKSTK